MSVNDHLVIYCASSYIHAFAPSLEMADPCVCHVDVVPLVTFPRLLFDGTVVIGVVVPVWLLHVPVGLLPVPIGLFPVPVVFPVPVWSP